MKQVEEFTYLGSVITSDRKYSRYREKVGGSNENIQNAQTKING